MPTLDKKTLCKIMKRLADERPRFCSEADFQFALAWKIQENYPDAEIRFGCPVKMPNERTTRIDTIVKLGNSLFPIELKYKLKVQKRTTQNHPDMLRDIDRLKTLRMEHLQDMYFAKIPSTIQNCFAIWLSDNNQFWTEGGKNAIFKHNGQTIIWEHYADDFMFALIDISERRS